MAEIETEGFQQFLPPWAQEGGPGAMRARLAEPEQRAKIRTEMLANLERRAGPGAIMFRRFDKPFQRPTGAVPAPLRSARGRLVPEGVEP